MRPQDAHRWGVLSVPAYRTFVLGSAVSLSGGWLLRTAQAWFVLDLTNSPAALGGVTVAQALPITILTLFAGVLIDRVSTRRVLLVAHFTIALSTVALAALVLTGRAQYWHLIASAVIVGIASAFEFTGRSTIVSELLDPSQVSKGVAAFSTLQAASRIVGPGIGGLLIALWGSGPAFALTAAAYVLSTGTILSLSRAKLYPKEHARKGAVLGQLTEGLRYAARTPSLAFNLLLAAFMGLFAYNWPVVLPLLARYGLEAGPDTFGALNGAMGIGSVVGGIVLVMRLPASRRVAIMGAIGLTALLAALSLAPTVAVALGVLLLLGVASAAFHTATNTLLQLGARAELRGRVLSLYMLVMAGSSPFGGTITSLLAERFTIRVALQVNAGMCLVGVVAACVYWWRHREQAAPVAGLASPRDQQPEGVALRA